MTFATIVYDSCQSLPEKHALAALLGKLAVGSRREGAQA